MIHFEIHTKRGVSLLEDYPRFWMRNGATINAALQQLNIMDSTYQDKGLVQDRFTAKSEMAGVIIDIIENNLMPTLPATAKLVMVVQSKANTEVKK